LALQNDGQQARAIKPVYVVDDGVHLMAQGGEAGGDGGAGGLDVGAGVDGQALAVDEEQVLLRVVDQPLLNGDTEEFVADAHRLGPEETLVHDAGRALHEGPKVHAGQDVAFQIDPGPCGRSRKTQRSVT